MATKTVKVTLTEKNDAGPLFDLFFSLNGGLSYTSSVDSTNLYLPYVGASTVANVDELSNGYQLKSKGVCINSVVSGSIEATPTPTPTPTFDPSVTPTPTPYPDPTATATPVPTATSVVTPTPTPACVTFGYHQIQKTSSTIHKSTWAGSGQAYNAFALVTYLTGQSSPTQYVPYALLNNVRIYDGGGSSFATIAYAPLTSTVIWYYDGTNVVVEITNVTMTGTYSDGLPYSDTWCYGLGHEVPPTPTATPVPTVSPTPSPTPTATAVVPTDYFANYTRDTWTGGFNSKWNSSVEGDDYMNVVNAETVTLGSNYIGFDNTESARGPEIAQISMRLGEFSGSLESWVRMNSTGSHEKNTLFGWVRQYEFAPQDYWSVEIQENTTTIQSDLRGDSDGIVLTGPNLNIGDWYHIVATYNDTTNLHCLYVNSVLVNSVTHNFNYSGYDVNGQMCVNQYPQGIANKWQNFNDIGIYRGYRRDLSPDEIYSIYQSEKSLYPNP